MTQRILAIHYTPPGVVGGVEHILRQQIDLLRSNGFHVRVVAGRANGDDEDVIVIPELNAAGEGNVLLEHELLSGAVSPGFHRAVESVRSQLAPLADRADFLLVHNAFTLHFSFPLTAALWQIARRRRPGSVIGWSHDLSWTNPLYTPGMFPGYPWDLLRHRAPNTRYVTISAERRGELLGLWHGRGEEWVSAVPNGIDPDAVLGLGEEAREIAARWRLYDRDVVMLLPVRITRRKNIELGIRTLSALRRRGLDAVYLISGPQAPHHPVRSSDYLAELRSLCIDLGVDSDTIFLASELGHNLVVSDVNDLYRLADVLFFPSAQEGFGLPILEAALARVPVVVSDIPIFREVGGDEARYVGLSEPPDKIAGVICEAVNGRAGRLRRRVLREFRWETILDRHLLPLFSA